MTWEEYDGIISGYNEEGDLAIEIMPLQDSRACAKWGETYTPGRNWVVYHNNEIVGRGNATNKSQAIKAAKAVLSEEGY